MKMSAAVQDSPRLRMSDADRSYFLAMDSEKSDPPKGQSFTEELELTPEEYTAAQEYIRKLRWITQAELARVSALEREKDELFLSFRRRLRAGVEVEPGPYTLGADVKSLDEDEDPVPGTCDGVGHYEVLVKFPK